MRNDLLRQRGATECFAKAGLAEGTTAATFKIAAPNGAGIDFAIDGICYHKADTDNIVFSSGHADLADGEEVLMLVQINSAGTVSTKRGVAATTSALNAGTAVLHWPEPDDDKCPIGAIQVKNATGAAFVFGTTDLGAASVTDQYFDFAGGMPQAPRTATAA